MTTTARNIVEQAAKDGGILGLGQTLNAEDVHDIFLRLQNMVAQWQKRRWLVPSLYDIAMIGNNEASNQIGPGQYWNTTRPDKIMAAYFIQLNSGISSPVSFSLYPMLSYEDYSRISLKQLNSWPTRFFYDNQFPYGNVFIWPIPTPSYEIHLILKSALGFSTTISSLNQTQHGAGYTDGVYPAVPLINLSSSQNGLSATANVTIAGGTPSAVALQNGGELYKIGDTMTLDTTIVGIPTIDAIFLVEAVESSLDSEMSFPDEYFEALISNLAVRVCVMYQQPVSPDLAKLARASLKTITGANTQVPTLCMPGSLRSGRRAGVVNADGGIVWADVA